MSERGPDPSGERGFLDELLPALASGLRLRCPRCHRGRMFRSLLQPNERCPACGLPLQSEPGDFTGALLLTLGVTGLFVVFGILALQLLTGLDGAQQTGIWVAFACLALPVAYTYFKGIWFALMYALAHMR